MDDKSILEEFNKDLHYLQLRYLYIPLNDYLWEHFLREQTEIRDKYKVHGDRVDRFVRAILDATTKFKEAENGGSKEKENHGGKVQEARPDGSEKGVWLHDQ